MAQSNAFLVGYCSLPLHLTTEQKRKFINDQIKENLFTQYKKGLEIAGKLRNKKLFSPSYYYLWGKYDVCILSEIDDLEFATRFFRPYNPIGSSSSIDLQNFDYKVITGINPIVKKAKKSGKLPYLSITQLKINSAFLIGNGLFLTSHLIEKIQSCIDEILGDEEHNPNKDIFIEYNICECYSYHELVIILTCNSLNFLKNAITRIRSLQINQINSDIYDKIVDDSIFFNLVEDKSKHIDGKLSNHLFESTFTTFGVHSDIHENDLNGWTGIPLIKKEEITFISKWNIKPGHYNRVLSSLNKNKDISYDDAISIAGKGDLMLIKKVEISINALNNNPLVYPGKIFELDINMHEHVIETYTTIGFNNKENCENDFVPKTHREIHANLKWLLIDGDAISNVRNEMKNLRIPKVLSEKVLKLISNYNNAVLNPDMYASYVELYFYITRNFINTIKIYNKNIFANIVNNKYLTRNLIDKLETACNCLETSMQNRFYQSYWTSEVLEVNIDYSGGLQNLISAYDACVKTLNNALMPLNLNSSFVFIKSDHKVSATPNALLLNYLHLTQPYTFCSIAIHETVNYIFEKWYHNRIFTLDDSKPNESGLIEVFGLLHSVNISFRIDYLNPKIASTIEKTPDLLHGPAMANLRQELAQSERNLIVFINELTFRYFLTDYINFVYGYDSDYELFCQTSWNYFIQTGNVYEKYEEINASLFITFSIRMFLVKKYAKEEKGNIYPEQIREFLQPSILKYESLIYFLVNNFSKNADFNKWFCRWADIINNNEYGLIPQVKQNNKVNIVYKSVDNFLFNYEDIKIDKLVITLNKYFKSFSKENEDDSILRLLPIYKYIIKNYLRFSSANLKILNRSSRNSGTPDISNLTPAELKNTRMFIDPCGGTFVIGEENRKKYFLTRIKFIRLFSHLSHLQKKQYVSKILSK